MLKHVMYVLVWGILGFFCPPFPLTSADGRIRPSHQLLSPVSPSSVLPPATFWGARRELWEDIGQLRDTPNPQGRV